MGGGGGGGGTHTRGLIVAVWLGWVFVFGCRVNSFHRRFIYKEHTSTDAQRTDPRVALGAYRELPWMYLSAWGGVDAGTLRPFYSYNRRNLN